MLSKLGSASSGTWSREESSMAARGRDERDGERGQILVMMVVGLLAFCAVVSVVAGIMDSRNCIYALNATAPAAVQLSGGVQVNANCGVVDDSNNGDALDEN